MLSWSEILAKYGVYLSVLAAATTALLQALGYMVPDYVYGIESAIGLTAFRTTISVTGAGPGWKSYLSAAAIALVAGLQAFGIDIPSDVYTLLAALGLGSINSAVKKLS